VLFPVSSERSACSPPPRKRRRIDDGENVDAMDVDSEPQDTASAVQPRDVVLETSKESFLLSHTHSKLEGVMASPAYDISLILEGEQTDGDVHKPEVDSSEPLLPTAAATPSATLDVPSALPSLTPTPSHGSPSDTTPTPVLTVPSDPNPTTDLIHTDTLNAVTSISETTAATEVTPSSPIATSPSLQKPKANLALKQLYQSRDEGAFQFTPSGLVVRDGSDIDAEWSVEVKRWRWA